MIRTLKAAFGLGILAALAMSVMSVMSAPAITSGHFTSDVHTTKLDVTTATGTAHNLQFTAVGTTVECHDITYSGHITGTTSQHITIVPVYNNCTTSSGGAATFTMNGCSYTLTPRTPPGHATFHFDCPVGVKTEWHTPSGTITFSPQTPTTNGVTYDTITANNKHALTLNATVEGIHYECHGACAIFGTSGTTAKLTGSATIEGTDPVTGQYVNITHT